jgi:hypothetical protein
LWAYLLDAGALLCLALFVVAPVCVGDCVAGVGNRVFVHRYNTTMGLTNLVSILNTNQTYNDFSADFYVTVVSMAQGVARLAFKSCSRAPPSIQMTTPPQIQLTPSLTDVSGFMRVPLTLSVLNNDQYVCLCVVVLLLTCVRCR